MIDKEYQFDGQDQKEEVVLVLKRHWWYLVSPSLITVVIRVIISIIIIITVLIWQKSSMDNSSIFFWIIATLLIVLLNSIITDWFRWSNTNYVVSNERIISAEQEKWFSRTVSEASLENILFVSHKVEGIIGTALNFGSVHIRASGVVEEEIVLEQVYDPYEVQQQIIALQKKMLVQESDNLSTEKKPSSEKDEKQNQKDKEFWKAKVKKKIIR